MFVINIPDIKKTDLPMNYALNSYERFKSLLNRYELTTKKLKEVKPIPVNSSLFVLMIFDDYLSA